MGEFRRDGVIRPLLMQPTPCENCPHLDACAKQEIACARFRVWVNRGYIGTKPIDPTPEIFRGLYDEQPTLSLD
jgi:hypothetical protein